MPQTFTNTSSMAGMSTSKPVPEPPESKSLLSPSGMSSFETNYNPSIKPFELKNSSSNLGSFQPNRQTSFVKEGSDNKEKSPLYIPLVKPEEPVVKEEYTSNNPATEKPLSPPTSPNSQISDLSKEKSPISI